MLCRTTRSLARVLSDFLTLLLVVPFLDLCLLLSVYPMAAPLAGNESVADEKANTQHKETMITGIAHDAAERGHLATDQYGHALVEFDKAAESRLRLKIDLYIVPTVALMYLFCFIDRANIGEWGVTGI